MVDASTPHMSVMGTPRDLNLKETPWALLCEPHGISCCGLCYDAAQEQAEQSQAVVLRGLLSPSEIDTIVELATQVLPHLCGLAEQCGGPCAGLLSPDIEGLPHDTAFSEEHVMLNTHRDRFFQENFPLVCDKLVNSMVHHGMTLPLISADWQRKCASTLALRCIELHTYCAGGALVAPGHRDNGSVLSMAVVLTSEFAGGSFVTYATNGAPIVHDLSRGDAILFLSEKTHNVRLPPSAPSMCAGCTDNVRLPPNG